MSVKIEVDVDIDGIKRRSRTRIANGLNEMANDAMRLSVAGTPRRTGKLRQNIIKSAPNDLTRTVTWRQPYAGYQETRQYRHYTTPGTGPHYAENAAKQVANNWRAYFS